jgi:hypothetical protein
MTIQEGRHVLMCLKGQIRSVDADREAKKKGYNTRVYKGGKWEFCQRSQEQIKQEIAEDETVVIIDDSHTDWSMDGKATVATKRLLDQAGRKHRTLTNRQLLDEIANGSKHLS